MPTPKADLDRYMNDPSVSFAASTAFWEGFNCFVDNFSLEVALMSGDPNEKQSTAIGWRCAYADWLKDCKDRPKWAEEV